MPKIMLRPSGREIEIDEKTNLLEALRREEIFLNSSCGGYATCSDCRVVVKGGEDYLNPPSFEELQLLGNVFHMTKERLACQMKVTGDVTVDISLHKNVKIPEVKDEKKVASRVRKKDDLEQERKEREEARAERMKSNETESWYKHWEKDEAQEGPKKLGGGQRPKPFRTDNLDTLEIDKDKKGD